MLAKIFGNRSELFPVLLRIGAGLTFLFAGWSKLGNFSVPFFTTLGIPLPGIAGPFITFLELIGGICLILGIGTRLFSLRLIGDMLVAIFVGKMGGAQGFLALGLPGGWNAVRVEVMLLLTCVALIFTGPGKYSIENNLLKREIP